MSTAARLAPGGRDEPRGGFRARPGSTRWCGSILTMASPTALDKTEMRNRLVLLVCLLGCGAFPVMMLVARATVAQLSYTLRCGTFSLPRCPCPSFAVESAWRRGRGAWGTAFFVAWLLVFPNSTDRAAPHPLRLSRGITAIDPRARHVDPRPQRLTIRLRRRMRRVAPANQGQRPHPPARHEVPCCSVQAPNPLDLGRALGCFASRKSGVRVPPAPRVLEFRFEHCWSCPIPPSTWGTLPGRSRAQRLRPASPKVP